MIDGFGHHRTEKSTATSQCTRDKQLAHAPLVRPEFVMSSVRTKCPWVGEVAGRYLS